MGNMMGNRTGFQKPMSYEDKMKELSVEEQAIVETPKGTDMYDVISSFGTYANMRNPDGTYKTTGEAGFEQAEQIAEIRKNRKDLQDAAKLKEIEEKKARLITEDDRAFDMKKLRTEYGLKEEQAIVVQELQNKGALDVAKIQFDPARTATGLKIKELKGLLDSNEISESEYNTRLKDILSGTSTQKDLANITAALISGGGDPKTAAADAIRIYLQIQGVLGVDLKATGGRAGYQMGTSSTGAMPVQTAEVTETVEEVKEPNEASVPMSYQDFRAKIPAEVSDEIVQLIYYNQNAFADFAQITTQADVYAFNNKYGVSLVLPMQTEMT
jgi:hypothetical protein